MAAVTQDITAEQGAALAVTLAGAVASLQGRTLRMHVRSKVGVTTTKLVASTSDGRLTVGANPYTTATLAIDADIMAAVSITLPTEYWVYDVESYTSAADVRREWSGRFTISRDVTRDTEAATEAALSGAVLYSGPQSLTTAQQDQAWDNIGGDEAARDAIGAALVAGSGVTVTVSDVGDTITIAATGGGGGGSGDVVGPASAIDDRIAAFDSTTGKLIKQGSVTATAVASHLGSTSNPHSVTAAQAGADPAGTAASAVSAHSGAVDPHGDRSFATSAVSTHAALTTGVHGLGGASQLNVGTTAGTVAAGDHAHTGTYQPLATVLTNTTAAFTTAQETKLSGIETAADVTDAGNVGTAIDGATAKTTPVDADTVPLIDSAAGNVLKKLSWANIKATAKTYFDTLYQAASATLTTWAGITPGTGIATALAVNVGTAGAPVVNGGALGTPSSGTLTNATGLPPAGITQSGATSNQVLTWNGSAWAPATPSAGSPAGSSGQMQYNNASAFGAANLWRESADIIALRNSTTAQTFYVYGTYTDASNYVRLTLSNPSSGVVSIAAETAGTGADNIDIVLTPAGTGGIAMGPSATASGDRGVAGGNSATASGGDSVAFGSASAASGSFAVAIGRSTMASATGAYALGHTVIASGAYSIATGFQSTTRGLLGARAHSSSARSAVGDAQVISQPVRRTTTDATPVSLATDGTPAATTVMVIPSESVAVCRASVVALNTAAGVISGAGFEITALVKNDSGTTALLGAATTTAIGTADAALTTATCTLIANNTLDSVEIQATGVAATTIHWVGKLEIIQVL